jgi:cardiolipin synthase
VLSALTRGATRHYDKIELLTNGEVYYPAELDAIRQAKRSINLEAYIFEEGDVTNRFIEALTARAREGVKDNVMLDAIVSDSFSKRDVRELIRAGGRLAWYHPIRWHTWPRINNRTHRELLIIDGKVGFVGGSGWADHWMHSKKGHPRWRDTMVRVDGEGVVAGLQATFAENWLEASGEILTGREYFPVPRPVSDGNRALVVGSSPGAGRSTEGRVLFQTLLASARARVLEHSRRADPRREGARSRGSHRCARTQERSCRDSQFEPASLRRSAACGCEDLRVPAGHDSHQEPDCRQPLVGRRIDEHGFAVLPFERRSQSGCCKH